MHLKEMILARLLLSENHSCSGGMLAEEFSVSRTAIWKAIEQLKSEGCRIEAISRKGYFLVEKPDIFNRVYLETQLKDCRTDWQIQHFDVLDSTCRLSKELAARNAPAGTVIVADTQTAGRGRMGKQFYSPKGGLYFSIIQKPDLPLTDMMGVTACTATAIFQALQQFGITTAIKWVNDIYLHEKKICGILSEGSFDAELHKMDYLTIGIGINLRKDADRPEALRPIITDIETETGERIPKYDLLIEILKQFEILMSEITSHSYLSIYTEHSYTLGHMVRADDGTEGMAEGFTEDAGLILRLPDKQQRILRTGSVRILDPRKPE